MEDGVEWWCDREGVYAKDFGREDVLILYRQNQIMGALPRLVEAEADRRHCPHGPFRKGLGSARVIVIGLTECFFPNVWENDRMFQIDKKDNDGKADAGGERRLFYVAVTWQGDALPGDRGRR